MKKKILVGSVVKQHPDVLRAFVQALQWQAGDFQIDLSFIDDNDDEQSKAILLGTGGRVEQASPKPDGAKYSVNSQTHDWSVNTFYWLAREKQWLIEQAKEGHYDALWLVDSDLLCSPDTLSSLWHTRKDVVSAVFWTRWTPDAPPLPQVWLAHPYELQGMGVEAHEFLGRLAGRQLHRVAGLGACTLIRSRAFNKVAFWPLVEGLPQHGMWQGEDRHFCVTAARNHVELYADAYPDVWHCYRPENRAEIPHWLESLRGTGYVMLQTLPPAIGEEVSFTIEPLEEPKIAGYVEHVRGRVGALKLLPEIETAITSMRAGDEQIIKLSFPLWYPIKEYQGATKLVRVRLLHVKPYAQHPGMENVQAQRIGEQFMENAA